VAWKAVSEIKNDFWGSIERATLSSVDVVITISGYCKVLGSCKPA